jgi:hypothetical protein
MSSILSLAQFARHRATYHELSRMHNCLRYDNLPTRLKNIFYKHFHQLAFDMNEDRVA